MRKGFTLIELLIVVTIIAILAGAAIPYVQEYIEDARISRCKADLDEIKNALIRYELDKGAPWPGDTEITKLVGPYLAKALIDPWGNPYHILATSSVVVSAGPNRIFDCASGTMGDDIFVQFRPPMALVKAYWIDSDNSGSVTNGDKLSLKFTRTASDTFDGTNFILVLDGIQIPLGTNDITTDSFDGFRGYTVKYATDIQFLPGRDSIIATGIQDIAVPPFGPKDCLANEVTIQALQ